MVKRRPESCRSGGESPFWASVRVGLAVALVTPVVLHVGWPPDDPLVDPKILRTLQALLAPGYILALLLPILPAPREQRLELALRDKFEWATATAALLFIWHWPALAVLSCALVGLSFLNVFILLMRSRIPPGAIFVGSFAGLIAIGSLALKLPTATPPDKPITYVDALFTSTSAVCVTGLVVRDTGSGFTRLGHTIILTLVQLGGLGIITFGAVLAMVMGGAIGLRGSRAIADTTGEGVAPSSIRRLVAFIAASTLLIEAAGAGTLYFGWPQTWATAPDMSTAGDRVFHCVFASVCGFCNAGFMATPDNLVPLRFHWTSHLVIAPLIVLGSIGFPVLDNLLRCAVARLRGRRIVAGAIVRPNLHTKMVLLMTAIVYAFGFLLLMADRAAFAGQGLGAAALDAHFMSITTRTAGFETVPPAEYGPLGRFVMIIQMFIGGSPGSTAGGVKTVVVAVLALAVWNTITGAPHAHAFKRNIPEQLFRKAATLITLQVALVCAITGALTVTEHKAEQTPTTEAFLFEAISATSTVGLTLALSPRLTDPGKAVVSFGMFAGRVGPLALLAAIVVVARRRRGDYEYPTEGVVMS